MKGLCCGFIGIFTQAIGVADAALDVATKYSKDREKFGRKISKFQGLV